MMGLARWRILASFSAWLLAGNRVPAREAAGRPLVCTHAVGVIIVNLLSAKESGLVAAEVPPVLMAEAQCPSPLEQEGAGNPWLVTDLSRYIPTESVLEPECLFHCGARCHVTSSGQHSSRLPS